MRAIYFRGNGTVETREVPIPQPRGTEVLVRMRSASICGTDRENLIGGGQPTVPGHENAGEVAAVRAAVRARVGDRVAINCHVTCGNCEHCRNGDLHLCDQLRVIGFDRDGGFADFVLVPESCCVPIPDVVSFEQASLMVDMLGTPFQAFKRAACRAGDQVAIWGAGPIGLGLLMTAVQAGVRTALIDTSAYRLELARDLKPEIVINPGIDLVRDRLWDWTGGRGVKTAFECVGNEKVGLQAIASLSKKGTLVVVGVSHSLTINPWEHLIQRELSILGTRNFNTGYFAEMTQLIAGGFPLMKTVTHRFPIERASEAFSLFATGECGRIAIVSPAVIL